MGSIINKSEPEGAAAAAVTGDEQKTPTTANEAAFIK